MYLKNITFIIILIIFSIVIMLINKKEKYINPNDTNISIINFNCSAKPSVTLNSTVPNITCTPGDDPICLNHLQFSSTIEYI
jgi:hypothetical protein